MSDRRPSLQDRIRARRQDLFVGRGVALAQFEQNLTLPVDDPRRRFLISLYGVGGVGKTTLVERWQQLAERHGYAVGAIDTANDILSAIEQLTDRLAASGAQCTGFRRMLARYRKDRRTLDSDPNAPAGMSALLTRSAVRIGLRAAANVPVVGAFTEEIDKNDAAEQVDQLRAFLGRRLGRKHDPDLLLAPIEALSKAFVTDLWKLGDQRPVALFVDAFEQTEAVLGDWLLQLLEGRYGDLPAGFLLVLSGQHPLDANRWAGFVNIRADVELPTFTEAEARQLLAARGVTNPATANLVLELSGGLPVLVALLAAAATDDTARAADPVDTAVSRFLNGVPDPDHRAAAQAAALPRRLDREILSVAANPAADFDWMCGLPFVTAHQDGYRYHAVVRQAMLRSSRRAAPDNWIDRHRALATHYGQRKEQLALPAVGRWGNRRWVALSREETYHELCATGEAALPGAVQDFIDVYRWANGTPAWAQMIVDAGLDGGNDAVRARGEQLAGWVSGQLENGLAMLDSLAEDRTLDDAHRWYVLIDRAALQHSLGRDREALQDLDRADRVLGPSGIAEELRGQIRTELGEYQQALRHLDEAVRRNPDYVLAYSSRSAAYRGLQQYEEALADLDRAVVLDPADPVLLVARSSLREELNQTAEAKADLDRAVAVAPGNPAWLVLRAGFQFARGRFFEALADLDHAVELDPDAPDSRLLRAAVRAMLGREEDAVADLERVPRTGFEADVAAVRTVIEQFTGGLQPEEQKPAGPPTDAGELSDPDALLARARAYADQKRLPEAIAELDRAIRLAPRSAELLTVRADFRHRDGDDTAAYADLDRALELDPDSVDAIRTIGVIRAENGDYRRALAAFDQGIMRSPHDLETLMSRGILHQQRGDFAKAIADFDTLLEVFSRLPGAFVLRGRARALAGDVAGARRDLDRAVKLSRRRGPVSASIISVRGTFLLGQDEPAAALSDFNRALELAPEVRAIWSSRGRTYLSLGRYPEAIADYERAAEFDPPAAVGFHGQGLGWLYQGDRVRAEALFRTALKVAIEQLRSPKIVLPDDVPGQLDALRGLPGKGNYRFELVCFALAAGYDEPAARLLAAVLADQIALDAIPNLNRDLEELSRLLGPERVDPLLTMLTNR
ncbi:tetratricopeptide repeat protein [Kribbella solani]|uniref:tetratricopeptide repeat protein n=1 Tax=Kribbella solani TaxID=236067 RepID=UPI0029BC2C24|nr:tetratricopeptide repeat protein [Kribbella solani]MDX3002829.1 tetratricopeptide repeat protein [Kribbella solani]